MLEQLAQLDARKRELLIESETNRRLLRREVEPIRELAHSVDVATAFCRSALGSWREALESWRTQAEPRPEVLPLVPRESGPTEPGAGAEPEWLKTVALGMRVGRLVVDVWRLFRRL